MQYGGGAYVSGSAIFSNCALHGNEAGKVRARILNFWTSSSAPLERYVTDSILLHAGRRGQRLWVCELHELQLVRQQSILGARSHSGTSVDPFFSAPLNSDTLRCFYAQEVGARI